MIEDIKLYGFWKTIKYAWQRVIRGYDERIAWGFDTYFNQFIPALKEFCKEQLPEKEVYNPKSFAIYKKTLRLIDDFEKMPYQDFYKHPNPQSELWKFVGEHISWYWS